LNTYLVLNNHYRENEKNNKMKPTYKYQHKQIWSIAVGFIAATMIMVLFSCRSSQDKDNNAVSAATEASKEAVADSGALLTLTQAQYKEAGIQLGSFEKKPLSKTIHVNGMVNIPPQSKISVSFPFGGFIRSIKVLEGDFVKKGSLLAVLENPQYVDLQEDYLKSKSALNYAQNEYYRQKALYQADIAAGKSYQKATSAYHSLQASVSATAQKLRMLGIAPDALTPSSIRSLVNIYAPASGYITKVDLNQGKYMAAQQQLLEINDTKNVHIDLSVYEKDAGLIKVGQKVLFTLPGEGEDQQAKIELIGREIRPDHSVTIHAVPLDRSKYYNPGSFVQAEISLQNIQTDVLPIEAVVRSGGRQFIFLKKQIGSDSAIEFQMIPVKASAESEGYIQVQIPASIDDTTKSIVTKGAFSLLSVLKNQGEEED